VTAYLGDGTQRWRFVQSPFAFILQGVSVGPDGNIYALATNGMGVFSLDPTGALRWQNTELYNTPIVSYGEIVFGPNGGTQQLYFYANHHLRGLRLDGTSVFEYWGGRQPVVSPLDGTVHLGTQALSPNGVVLWNAGVPSTGEPAAMGPDGVSYAQGFSQVYALNPDGTVKWTVSSPDGLVPKAVSPRNTRVLFTGYDAVTFARMVVAYTPAGQKAWQLTLPPSGAGTQYAEYVGPAFSPDGLTAYWVTVPGFLTAIRLE